METFAPDTETRTTWNPFALTIPMVMEQDNIFSRIKLFNYQGWNLSTNINHWLFSPGFRTLFDDF